MAAKGSRHNPGRFEACHAGGSWVPSTAVTRVHTESVAVRYAETDRMGVAHHSSYLLWFELARTGLLREAGFAYRDLESNHVRLPVIEYGCRFHKSADYDDTLIIRTRVRELRSRTMTFDYTVHRGEELLAEGFTHHICVDGEHRPRRFPGDVYQAISSFLPGP
jgi:acyl-CoA thioester hydrolase